MSANEIKALAQIKKYCKLCSGGSEVEATRCHMTSCPLYEFRPKEKKAQKSRK